MLYSIIDIGSNTVKISVLDKENIFSSSPVFFKAVPLNLRSQTEHNRLKDQAILDLSHLLDEFNAISGRLTKNPPIVFATASLRGLENADEVLKKIKEQCGIDIQIISGKTEAYFSFLGAKGSSNAKSGIVVDLGGGSTEILTFRENKVISSVSLPFGCLSLFHQFFEKEILFDACCDHIRKELKASAPPIQKGALLLSGGSSKAVLKYKNLLERKHNSSIGAKQFRKIKSHYWQKTSPLKPKLEQILKDRYRLIPPALAVFSEIMNFYEKEICFVCQGGVREGCLIHSLKKD